MKLTYYGHSCYHFEANGKHVLVDPYITPNGLAAEIDIDSIPVDYLLLTHGHEDHIADAEGVLRRTGATVIASFEIVTWFQGKGYHGFGMNIGGKHEFDFGTLRVVVAHHSSRLPDGSNGGNPMGYVVTAENSTFYIAGDTGLTMDMKLIPMLCPPLDFAILPVGGVFTMEYIDVPLAAGFLNCSTIVGCHFDTFDAIKINHDEVMAFWKEHGIEGHLMSIGQTNEF